jgi:radical SAM superfamily enzyme YgiQ (UPF0313 family)
MKRKKVLFLNPPGKKIYIRDYYCSKVSKAYYLPQPVDLLVQSSFFSDQDYELKAIDAIVSKLSCDETISQIEKFNPNVIIGMMGSVSLLEDESFYQHLGKTLPHSEIFLSGDALLDAHSELFDRYSWLNGIITNFFNNGVQKLVSGKLHEVNGLVYLQGDDIITTDQSREAKLELAVPKQHLFPRTGYRMPFANAEPIATVLTNYACPYPCTFCIMSTMPYITRSAKSIIDELQYLKERGYRYIYFSDQTFFQSKSVTHEVLNWMIEENYGLNWMCFSRVDVLAKQELELMKSAGCNLIMFGVEFADEVYLEQYKKHYTLEQIRTTFALSKKIGIKRLGTFLIGVPGQTEQSIVNTIEFAKEIKADYASFNVAVPRSNTSFREEALEQGIIDESVKVMDQSGDEVTMGTGVVSREKLEELKQLAYRSFYFRPSYILQRLLGIRNWIEFQMHLREAYYILKGLYKRS